MISRCSWTAGLDKSSFSDPASSRSIVEEARVVMGKVVQRRFDIGGGRLDIVPRGSASRESFPKTLQLVGTVSMRHDVTTLARLFASFEKTFDT